MRSSLSAGLAAAALAGVVAASSANASTLLDQANPTFENLYFNGAASSLTWQQQVTAGLEGILDSVQIYISYVGTATEQINFFVNTGSGWQADANDFSSTPTLLAGWNSIDVSGANISLSVGDKFSIGLNGVDGGGVNFDGTTGDKYSGGEFYLDGSLWFIPGWDMTFKTYVTTVAAVPLPAAFPMLLAALGGLGFAARRRKAA